MAYSVESTTGTPVTQWLDYIAETNTADSRIYAIPGQRVGRLLFHPFGLGITLGRTSVFHVNGRAEPAVPQ